MALNLTARRSKPNLAQPEDVPFLTTVQLLPGASKENIHNKVPAMPSSLRIDPPQPQ